MQFGFLLLLMSTVSAWSYAGSGSQVHKFPTNFEWCAATAAHQIEGDNFQSDWWEFEKSPGSIKNGERSGKATDHWNHTQEDLQIMKDLHLRKYRFSVEWAKIEPEKNRWDYSVLEVYRKEIDRLKANGIEPMITLNHFTLPLWFAREGGWENDRSPTLFLEFVSRVYGYLGDGVRDWVTFNEPMVLISGGYIDGSIPPQKKDYHAASHALVNILKSHALAYRALHFLANGAEVRVGFAHHLRIFDPLRRGNPLDRWLTHIANEAWNWAIASAPETGHLTLWLPFLLSIDEEIPGLKGTQDFFGLNYYTRDRISFTWRYPFFNRTVTPGAPINDLGWEIYPTGMRRILVDIAKRFPNKPIFITENGIADSQDRYRSSFLTSHLTEVLKAIDSGIPVEGYCHWSLMDNFEWIEGFTPRFGLYSVDYSTQKRTPRESAQVYSKIAETYTLPED